MKEYNNSADDVGILLEDSEEVIEGIRSKALHGLREQEKAAIFDEEEQKDSASSEKTAI